MGDWIGPVMQHAGKSGVLVGIGIGLASLIMAMGKRPEKGSKPSILGESIEGRFTRLCEILALSVAGAVTAGFPVLAETPEFGDVWRLLGIFGLFVFASVAVVSAIELISRLLAGLAKLLAKE
jgi:hypothetical protein